MTDEEAIKRLKYDISAGEYSTTKTEVLETVLNLIEKQQKEIEELKGMYKHQSRDISKAVDYTFELNKEIEEKEEIIELMAEYFEGYEINDEICLNNKEDAKEYFKRKVEDK